MIILNSERTQLEADYALYPDFFVSESEKRSKGFIAQTLDFYHNIANREYYKNCKTWAWNYKFVKGQLRPEDFYENPEVLDFGMELSDGTPLPSYVQRYSIINQPINTLTGEETSKPDDTKIKAFDDDSRSETLQYRTDLLTQYVTYKVQQRVAAKLAEQGIDMETDEGLQRFESLTQEELEEELASFTTQGEKWGNHILSALKMEFNMKEQSEEGFRDLCIAARERFLVYEDLSKLGFKVRNINPKNCWKLSSENKRYNRDAFANGTIELMEISEIIEEFPLSKKEIDHLRKCQAEAYLVRGQESNLFSGETGINSIHYNTYNPLRLEESMRFDSQLFKDSDIDDYSLTNLSGVLGQKFVVLRAYYLAKMKIGKLTYIDQDDIEQTTLVDENYKSGNHPRQIELEWGYTNQWWYGYKIGADIYHAEPFKLLSYNPLIGVDWENRNSDTKSLVDLMKPYQVIFDLCMNQLWELLQKEKGVVLDFNIRKIPVGKDEAYEDAINNFLLQAKELGVVFNDDSPENMQAPSNNTNTTKALDLTRTQEMQSRLAICQAIKAECHSLVGMTPERQGGGVKSQTAFSVDSALQSSYSQTASLSSQHSYVMNQVYQAIIDAAKYIESKKEVSTVSYITNTGENAFIQMIGSDLEMKDLRIYVTDRKKDEQTFQELKSLAQPMLQGGSTPYDITELYVTDSIRQLRDTYRKDKRKREEQLQQANQLQQQQIEAQREAAQAQIQAQIQDKAEERAFKAKESQLDRLSKERIALLQAAGRDKTVLEDGDNNGVADALETVRFDQEVVTANRQYELDLSKVRAEAVAQQNKIVADQEKTKVDEERYEQELALKKEKLRIDEKKIDASLKNPVVGEKK